MGLNEAQKLNNTSQIMYLEAFDTTTGKLKTGLAYNTSGLVVYTGLNGAAPASIGTLVTMTEGTWTSLGFKECANIPGRYQVGMPNAVLSSATGPLFLTARITSDDTIYFRAETIPVLGVDAYSASPVDANVKTINGTTVNGNGGGTPWGA